MKKFKFSSERGDTIVEVLISIAIISLILGGAFATTSRSLRATRDTQERSDGLKLVESQIEQLKGVAVANPTAIFGSDPGSFCVSSGSVVASSSTACAVNAAGSHVSGSTPEYRLVITRVMTGQMTEFTIVNTWDGITGKQAKVQMKYRLYP